MDRHYSFGTADLVALMAAHRATMARPGSRFDQSVIGRFRAALDASTDLSPYEPAAGRSGVIAAAAPRAGLTSKR